MADYLRKNLGFSGDEVRIMTDNSPCPWDYPTKDNILEAMRGLVHDAQPHDSLFFYFSGHSHQIHDLDGDEQTGFEECICATDYRGDELHPNFDTPGLIVDDVMHEVMVQPLQLRCRLTAMFDSCHSGTLLDLPYLYNWDGVVKEIRHPDELGLLRQKVSLGASMANQRALEMRRGSLVWGNVTYGQLVQNINDYMTRHGFLQKPHYQLSSSHKIEPDLRFII
ncbi:caspase domain-containing protein [Russula compacta]|nr:caspase domain-containing protein [Russula compacta]